MKRMASGGDSRTLAVLVVLSSDRSLEELLNAVPLTPDRCWQKGSRRGRGSGNEHRYSGFEIRSRLDRRSPAEAHLGDLLERIRPALPALRALVGELRIERGDAEPCRIWLELQADGEEAAIDVPTDQLRLIAQLGSRLGVTVELLHEVADDDREEPPEPGLFE